MRADERPAASRPRLAEGTRLGGAWGATGDLVGHVNPSGIATTAELSFRDAYRFSERYDTVSGYREAGLGLGVTPAYVQPSVHLEWMPWVFLVLRLQGDFYGFFGAHGSLLSFPSADSPFGGDVLRSRHDEESATGARVLFQPTLQVRFGGLALRNQTDLAYYRFSGRGPFFYEQEYDTLLTDGDLLEANRTALLVESRRGPLGDTALLLGPYYEVTHAQDARLTRHQAGLQLLWVAAAALGPFARPRLYAQAGFNLEDPNRGRQPVLAIGVGADLDP